jgi:hypothetical protein
MRLGIGEQSAEMPFLGKVIETLKQAAASVNIFF